MDFKRTSETVEFKDADGKTVGVVTVSQAGAVESAVLYNLTKFAQKKNADELLSNPNPSAVEKQRQFNREYLYPRMAACSDGNVPDMDDWLPETEMDKWYLAAKRQNPKWFEIFDAAVKLTEEEQKAEKKRSGRKRHKS